MEYSLSEVVNAALGLILLGAFVYYLPDIINALKYGSPQE